MAHLVGNFVETTLASPVSTGDLTIVLSSVPSTFPAIGAGSTCYLVLEKGPRSNPTRQEVVLATARTGSVVTVTRSQDGTTPQGFDPGDRVCLRFVRALYDDLSTRVAAAQADATTSISDAAAAQADATTSISDAAAAQSSASALAVPDYILTASNGAVPNGLVFSATGGGGLQFSAGSLSLDQAAVVGLGLIKDSIVYPEGQLYRLTTDSFTPVSRTCYALYMGRADKAYTSAKIAWRTGTAASVVTYAEFAVATGLFTIASAVTLTQRGFTSVSGDVTSANTNAVTTISLSGISVLDDLWILYGIQATGVGTLRAGLADNSDPGYVQSKVTTQPQTVSGSVFASSGTIPPIWLGVSFS